jgi:pimeloyl-ACP methyl ester carboxylesterase
MINWYRALMRHRLKSMDVCLSMPVRIRGRQDAFLCHEMAHTSAGFCDQAEVTLFDDATHWLQHEEAEAVNRALLGFFRE